MNINDLEKRMREALGGEKAAVNTEDLWENIQSDLPTEQESKRAIKWSSLLPFLLLIGGASAYFLYQHGLKGNLSNESKIVTNINSQQSSSEKNIAHSFDNKASEVKVATITNENRSAGSEAENESINDKKYQIAQIQSNPNQTVKTLANIETENASTYNRENQTFSSFSYSPVHNSGQNVNLTEKAESVDRSRQNRSSRSYSATPLSLNSNQKTDNLFYTSSNDGINNSNSLSRNQSRAIKTNFTNTNESINSSNPNLSPIAIQDIEELLATGILNSSPTMDEKQPFWIERDRLFYFEIGSSLINGHGQLALENADFSSHFNNRNAAEKSLPSYGFDAKIGYQINEQFSVHSGLIATRLFKSSNAAITTIEDITIQDGLIQEIIGSNSTQEIRGQVSGVRQTSSTVKRINNYNFIHIPLGASYTYTLGAVDFRISTEARIGISASYQGFVHPTRTEEYDISTDSEDWFDKGSPHFLSIGTGIRYPLSNIFSITFDANYQYQLGSINTNTYGITENLSGIGIRTGIHIKI